jgi:hypothetical protein
MTSWSESGSSRARERRRLIAASSSVIPSGFTRNRVIAWA